MAAFRGFIQAAAPSVNVLLRKSLPSLITSSHFLPRPGSLPTVTAIAGLRTHAINRRIAQTVPKTPLHQQTVVDKSKDEELTIEEVVSKVNSQIDEKSYGRLFAVVHLANRQWKITPEDVLVVEGFWPPDVGDVIRLEKVLLVGSSDFSLVGMPLLRPDLVNIQATVVEKRLSHTKTNFKKKRRKQYQRINYTNRP